MIYKFKNFKKNHKLSNKSMVCLDLKNKRVIIPPKFFYIIFLFIIIILFEKLKCKLDFEFGIISKTIQGQWSKGKGQSSPFHWFCVETYKAKETTTTIGHDRIPLIHHMRCLHVSLQDWFQNMRPSHHTIEMATISDWDPIHTFPTFVEETLCIGITSFVKTPMLCFSQTESHLTM